LLRVDLNFSGEYEKRDPSASCICYAEAVSSTKPS
jgi:hypothetical protein